jgi:hypothetical protein
MREKAAKLAAVDADLAASFDFPEAAWKKVSDRTIGNAAPATAIRCPAPASRFPPAVARPTSPPA